MARQKHRSHPAAPLYPQLPAPALNADQSGGALQLSFTQMVDTIANAQVLAAAVTQHQGSLSLTFAQLSNTIANAQVLQAAVTQHQAALAILRTQITGWPADADGFLKNTSGALSWSASAATVTALDDIGDVNAPTPSDAQALVWNAATSKWIPATVASATPKATNAVTGTVKTDVTEADPVVYTKASVDTALALKAPLASPALTGTPTAPTAAANDNSTKIATTAYVETAVAAVPAATDGDFMSVRRLFSHFYRSAATTMASLGCINTANGTGSTPAIADTNVLTRQVRIRYTGTTATGQICGIRSNETLFMSKTGFRFRALFGIESNISDSRGFVGINSTTTILNAEPSAATDVIGVSYDAADLTSANWYLIHNDAAGAATRVDTGVARGTDKWLRLEMDSTDGTSVTVKLYDLTSGALTYSGTIAANLPTVTTALRLCAQIRNEVTAGGTIPILAMGNMYCEYGTTM